MAASLKIIYGTAWKQERTAQYVVSAILQGFRGIDTACQPKHYREDLVGEALQTLYEKHSIKGEDIFLQTKYTPIGGQDTQKPIPYNPSDSVSEQIASSLNVSLANLHTTYLDSYLLHSPLRTLELTLEAWRTLGSLKDSGKVRMIGVSNTYDVHVLEALEKVRKVDIVQNRWYQGNNWDKEVLKYCVVNGIQYQSFWTLTGSPKLLSNPNLVKLAQDADCTPEQAMYNLAQTLGITPLSGTKDKGHMREAVAAEHVKLGEGQDFTAVLQVVWD